MALYTKTIGGRQVFSDCRTIQTNEGVWISNPTQEQIADAGWELYVPPVVPPQPRTEPDLEATIQAVKKMLSSTTEELSDEDALSVAELFPTYTSKIGQAVTTGERLWWDGRLWKAIQDIPELLANWTPDTAVSLFVEVSIEEWPEWKQPVGASDAYAAGDKVTHDGLHWISDVDANVWEPGVYGWTQLPS